ncbi:hypothetical protein ElyMa_000498900, partial [Elysia marginata]
AQSLGEDTPYAFDTPIDAPLAMPQMPVNPEGAELPKPVGVATDSEEANAEGMQKEEKTSEEGDNQQAEEAKENEMTKEEKNSPEEKHKDAKDEEKEQTN